MVQKRPTVRVHPIAGITGGEVTIDCKGFPPGRAENWSCHITGTDCRVSVGSKKRVLAIVPGELPGGESAIDVEIDGLRSEFGKINIGAKLAEDLHPVANPAIDPDDGSLFVTRSGPRGQHLPVSLFRVDDEGEIESYSGDVTNPTGLAFSRGGELFVSSRQDGIVYRIDPFKEAIVFARELGVATGIAFGPDGTLFVGDRSGIIHRVNEFGESSPWAPHEPSVAAYHLAFGPDHALYVTGPTISSFDSVTRFDQQGRASTFFRGLGRPQGLAFDTEGNLYVAASYKGRRGIIRILPGGMNAELVVAGANVVGLCFTADNHMVIATKDSVYKVPFDARGTLIN